MFDRLEEVEKRYNDLNELLSDPDIISRQFEYQKYAKEQSDLAPIMTEYRQLKRINRNSTKWKGKKINEYSESFRKSIANIA